MSEPIDEFIAPAASAVPEYGAPVPAGPPLAAPDPVRGILAGAGAAVVGAVVWALVVYVTNFSVGFLAIGVGYLVGLAVHRVGRAATPTLVIAAAVLSLVGIILGYVLVFVAAVARFNQVGLLDAFNGITDSGLWGTAVASAFKQPIHYVFMALAVYAAVRLVNSARR